MWGHGWGVGREDFPVVGVKVIAYVFGICIKAVSIHKTRYAAGGGEKNFLFFPPLSSFGWSNNQTDRRQVNKRK